MEYLIVLLIISVVHTKPVANGRMPLVNNLRAPLVAELDITNINEELKEYINNYVDDEVNRTCFSKIETTVNDELKAYMLKNFVGDFGGLKQQLTVQFTSLEDKLRRENTELINNLTNEINQLNLQLRKETEQLKELEHNLTNTINKSNLELRKEKTLLKSDLKELQSILGTKLGTGLYPKECSEIPSVEDGVYTIWPNGVNNVSVWCVGLWTVIQKRYDGSVDFKRNWTDFKTGFGSSNGEYWLGNDNIHLISTNGPHKIRILMTLHNGTEIYADYSTFNVGDESTKYLLNISGYSGNAGDKMGDGSSQPMNRMQFSTIDQDNDKRFGHNCAVTFGVWWHNDCFDANLNAIYGSRYFRWSPIQDFLRKSVMMINRK